MQIGEVIRKYRKEAGITQEKLAKRLGVTTPAVNKWENNNTQPDIALLSSICTTGGKPCLKLERKHRRLRCQIRTEK